MGIIIAYITGRSALRKKQYYILPMCVLFICYNLLVNIIVSLPSFFTENPMLFIRMEIIILLLFLANCMVASQKATESSKRIIPWCLISVAFLLRVIRIVYSRIVSSQLRCFAESHEKYLDVAQNGMVIIALLLCSILLICFLLMFFFLINLRKAEHERDTGTVLKFHRIVKLGSPFQQVIHQPKHDRRGFVSPPGFNVSQVGTYFKVI